MKLAKKIPNTNNMNKNRRHTSFQQQSPPHAPHPKKRKTQISANIGSLFFSQFKHHFKSLCQFESEFLQESTFPRITFDPLF